jgi:O-phosphoseryl-tRNA(Cys) synthetase
MANTKTQTLNDKAKRLREIRDTFKNSQVDIDDLVPLVDEAIEKYNFMKERLDNTLKALEEKEKNIKSDSN